MMQYNKYGNYMPLEMGAQMFDVRLGQQFLFYIVFTILTGILANPDQNRGIAFARAIGIIFLLNELEQLFYYDQIIENQGSDTIANKNQRVEMINAFFPNTWCVFEKIEVQRLVYFLIFNLSCCISGINFASEDEHQIDDLKIVKSNAKEIEDGIKLLFKKKTGEDFSRKPIGPNHALIKTVTMENMKGM